MDSQLVHNSPVLRTIDCGPILYKDRGYLKVKWGGSSLAEVSDTNDAAAGRLTILYFIFSEIF